jgi:hypothetical protein
LILEHFKTIAAARGCDGWSLTCRIEPATIREPRRMASAIDRRLERTV